MQTIPRLSDAATCKKYCESLALQLTTHFDDRFSVAVTILIDTLRSYHSTGRSERDLPQDKELTKQLLNGCRSIYLAQFPQASRLPAGVTETFDGVFLGMVGQLVPEKKFGFIEYGKRTFFFHVKDTSLKSSMKVRFKVRKMQDSVEAYDVIIVN